MSRQFSADDLAPMLIANQKAIISMQEQIIAVPRAKGDPRTLETTRYGSSAEISEPLPGTLLPNVPIIPMEIVGDKYQLIRLNMEDMRSAAPGSWVLTLSSEVLDVGPTGPSITRVNPLVADILFGSGGTHHRVQVDAQADTIALPSQTAFVTVGYAPISTAAGAGGPGSPNASYARIRVNATMQKAAQNGMVQATRSFWVLDADPYQIPIPPFAQSWRIELQQLVPNGSLPVTSLEVRTAQGVALDQPVPEVLESMARTLCSRPIPPDAAGGYMLVNLASVAWSGKIVFNLKF